MCGSPVVYPHNLYAGRCRLKEVPLHVETLLCVFFEEWAGHVQLQKGPEPHVTRHERHHSTRKILTLFHLVDCTEKRGRVMLYRKAWAVLAALVSYAQSGSSVTPEPE